MPGFFIFVPAFLALWGLTAGATPVAAQAPDGEALFEQHCAACHLADVIPRALAIDNMRALPPAAVVGALTDGAMRQQGEDLSPAERRAIAEFITGRRVAEDGARENGACAVSSPGGWPGLDGGPLWNGWGVDVTNSRFQPGEHAGLAAEDVPRLRLKWAFGYPDSATAQSQPTVAGGRLFVASERGVVYALDAKTGCTHWTFAAQSGVRSAMSVTRLPDRRHALFFGDFNANVYALDAATGAGIWRRDVETHEGARITGAPVHHAGRLYVPVSSLEELLAANPEYPCCTFRGSIAALDAATGEMLWQSFTIPETPRPRGRNPEGFFLMGPSGAAVWSAPTVDAQRGLVYAATGNAYTEPAADTSDAIIAFDVDTGAIRWTNQLTPDDAFILNCGGGNPNCPDDNGPDFDFGASPVLVTTGDGRDLLVIGQKAGVGYALDPDADGAIVWRYQVGRGQRARRHRMGFRGGRREGVLRQLGLPDPRAGGLRRCACGRASWPGTPSPTSRSATCAARRCWPPSPRYRASSSRAPTTGCSAPTTPRTGRFSGSSTPTATTTP